MYTSSLILALFGFTHANHMLRTMLIVTSDAQKIRTEYVHNKNTKLYKHFTQFNDKFTLSC